eukprot:TRINITY_DN32498_c0_g1_i1.p1 TRINITY_DN32498_c0_g1~~TRINITY_DN32498_c0_g1_i1.p1  ORF type:complete len:479 (+),score=188.73 TRINITY_DN32498_c0_g1_i1:123-1559(+)
MTVRTRNMAKADENQATDSPAKSPARKDADLGKKIDLQLDNEVMKEFGGPVGTTAMMIFFPLLMYYLWGCLEFNQGHLIIPRSQSELIAVASRIADKAAPTAYACTIYLTFVAFQAFLAVVMPGPVVKGLPIPSENNRQLDYVCNGVASWYATLAVSFVLHHYKIWRLTEIVDNFAPIMTVAVITGFAVTFITYFATVLFGRPHRMSGNFFYDLFMGAALNPRLFGGRLDLKIWVEIRVPWVILFYVSLSAALKFYETEGYVSPQLAFMVLAHLLYVNACMKGEECIPTTWDIFFEKWGFMLIFWNFAGVPFTYCYSTIYLLKMGPDTFKDMSTAWLVLCYTMLVCGYYVWDTANSQKNRFRMSLNKSYIPRKTFPQLPWGTLENPKYITTKHGSLLLCDGWWKIARKIHYTADLTMALSWGFITGFGSGIPYFYVSFFTTVLVHRVTRDMERCAKKYGADWERYCKEVPYIFIPGLF